MGSHGGATADGQRQLLERYGITEAFCECPIRSSMETVIVCQAQEGFPVHFDRHAYEADHVVVCGRVKPHTRFVGKSKAALMKMMLIGLGKHAVALVYHQAIQDYSFGQILRSVAREVLDPVQYCGWPGHRRERIRRNRQDRRCRRRMSLKRRNGSCCSWRAQWMPQACPLIAPMCC